MLPLRGSILACTDLTRAVLWTLCVFALSLPPFLPPTQQELSDQQLKQMLLAYMVLIMKGRAMLPRDLDNACEDFLMKEFEHPIDYDLDAALPRLKTWGLVKENSQGKLEALPMSEAISILEQAWSVAYKEVGKEGEDKVPTIDMITGTQVGLGLRRVQNGITVRLRTAAIGFCEPT